MTDIFTMPEFWYACVGGFVGSIIFGIFAAIMFGDV